MTLQDLIEQEKCTPEQAQKIYHYYLAMKYGDDLIELERIITELRVHLLGMKKKK